MSDPPAQRGTTDITRRILDLLDSRSIPYTVIEHEPVFTSQQAAEARGTSPEQGARPSCERGTGFVTWSSPGSARVDNAKLRAILGTKRVRFASADELATLTGCASGAVPPFGNLFGLPVLVDRGLLAHEETAFNAGSHTVSLKMGTADMLRACDDAATDEFAASEQPHAKREAR